MGGRRTATPLPGTSVADLWRATRVRGSGLRTRHREAPRVETRSFRMMLLAEVRERTFWRDADREAMREHRLQNIDYQCRQVDSAQVRWTFFFHGVRRYITLLDCQTHEQADAVLKNAPLFPYASAVITPVVDSDAVVSEILSSLGQVSRSESTQSFTTPLRPVNQGETYWIVRKELPPLSPRVSETVHNDVLMRTVASKEVVDAGVELTDLNAVGRMAGFLIACGDIARVKTYVKQSPLYSQLRCSFEPLLTTDQALFTETRPPTYPLDHRAYAYLV